jgi:high-affinity iron transporter
MRLSFGPVRPCIRAVGKGCRYMFVLLLSAILSQIVPGQALASDTEVQTVWRLLDYVAVDYVLSPGDALAVKPNMRRWWSSRAR